MMQIETSQYLVCCDTFSHGLKLNMNTIKKNSDMEDMYRKIL